MPGWEPRYLNVRNAVRSIDITTTRRNPVLVLCQSEDGQLEVAASITVEYSGLFRNE